MKTKSIAIGLMLFVAVLAILLATAIMLPLYFPGRGTQLQMAAETGNLETVKSLIQQGAPINHQKSLYRFGWTPLIGAIYQRQTNVVKYLVESGADVNLGDRNGVTPLMYQIAWGDEGASTVSYLIAHGANLDAKDKSGATAFGYASSSPPKPRLIEILKAAKLERENKSPK